MITRPNAVRLSLITVLLGFFTLFALAGTLPQDAPAPAGQSAARPEPKKQSMAEFNAEAANAVLGQIRDGLEAHNPRRMLSAFDGDNFDGYLVFEDQLQAYFEKFEGFRVHFRILQTSVEGSKGIVLAEFDVEGLPQGGGAAMRRSKQLRFELVQGRKGWKIVDLRPRGFFS